MSDQEDAEMEQMRVQIEQAIEKDKDQAATAVEEQPAPSPEPIAAPEPEAPASEPAPVAPAPSTPSPVQDDPLKWAEKKGYKSPEEMARALLQKDQEFHKSRQKAEAEKTPPPPPAWQPAPQMGGYGYPPPPAYGYPPPPPRDAHREIAAHYNLHPEDVRAFAPLVADLAENVSSRRTAALEREIQNLQRSTARNEELMSLMQDPVFKDERVQREIHAILDSEPSLFQGPQVYTTAYHKALATMQRKQLQQGITPEESVPSNRPPVTAGGGNGSANTLPLQVTPRVFDTWTIEQQEAYLNSNGKILPKR